MSISFWSPRHLSIKLQGPGVDFQQTLPRPYALLGSHADCDIVVDDPTLDERSLLLVITNKGVRGVVLSSNAKKSGRMLKIDADRPFKLRNYELTVEATPHAVAEKNEAQNGSVFVVTWKEKSSRQFLQLADQIPILFGRKSPSQLLVDNEQLSAVHGCLIRSGERLFAIDFSSTNGTWIGNELVRCAAIQLGKSVRAGDQYFHFLRLQIAEQTELQPKDNAKLITQQEHAVAMCARLDGEIKDLNLQLDALRRNNVELEESRRRLESQLSDASIARDELVKGLVDDDASAKRARLLEETEAELRQREEELETMRHELLVERNVLKTLHQEIATPELTSDTLAQDDETCISSLEFHDLLEEAMESLPVIDNDVDPS